MAEEFATQGRCIKKASLLSMAHDLTPKYNVPPIGGCYIPQHEPPRRSLSPPPPPAPLFPSETNSYSSSMGRGYATRRGYFYRALIQALGGSGKEDVGEMVLLADYLQKTEEMRTMVQ
ncbi:hypothetical protein PoB_006750100 [Plakobranchus ocellatus]|uniref:Uncharacterized protein n=1 Tax=Plakobranchus ocellatus TaxID=259542 RepID=A0AAV4DAQ0_9GAST|nr:hypothetical protein PoB_006750100 [Plakobranchus ocellatus]